MTYSYDPWGNMLEKVTYAYGTATPVKTVTYSYGNTDWRDELTGISTVTGADTVNEQIVYDANGNAVSYRGATLSWEEKQLAAYTKDGIAVTYAYDVNGLRLRKTVNNETTDYYYNGSIFMSLVTGDDILLFSYDQAGNVISVNHNGTEYYYLRNGQGDIVRLIDSSGTAVVTYGYDSWGRPVSRGGLLASTIGTLNPFRYRGYVYDEETGLYYLQSRYYDPEICRFLSSDVLLSTGQGVLGCNSFAYYENSPVLYCDTNGMSLHMATEKEIGGGSANTIQESTEASSPYIDDVAIALAPKLYTITQQTNKECMAAIYSVETVSGKIYFAGPIFVGNHDNVVVPTILSYVMTSIEIPLISIDISMEGFVHSHPYCNGHNYKDFSGLIGDKGAALLTGSCYMVEPEGRTLYKVKDSDVISAYLRKGMDFDMEKYKVCTLKSLKPYSEKHLCD